MLNSKVKKILDSTADGRRVFEYYGAHIGNSQFSPLNSNDTKPSFSVYYSEKNSRYKFKDFGETGMYSGGDCIDFVMIKFKLGFKSAVKKIINDLHISINY